MSQTQSLRHILSSTENFLSSLPPLRSSQISRGSCTPPLVSALSLSGSLSTFQCKMVQSGLIPQISQVALAKATELAAFYERSYQQACHRIINSTTQGTSGTLVLEQLRRTYEHMFEQDVLPRFLRDALNAQTLRCNQTLLNKPRSPCTTRPTFNHAYVPLLEKFFEFNAYPSSMERSALAQKTMMSPRQIEVWFQNHRNRAKQNGKTLKKGSYHLGPSISIESLLAQMPDLPQHPNQTAEEDSWDEESLDEEEVQSGAETPMEPFSTTSPPHAFPTKYPPEGVDDPFPCQGGRFAFATPVWTRVLASDVSTTRGPIDVDELASLFATKLNFREGLSKGRFARTQVSSKETPWFSSIITRPTSAPIPALIRNVPSPNRTSHCLRSPASEIYPCFGVSPLVSLAQAKPKSRKAYPLSNRLPSTYSRVRRSRNLSRDSSLSSVSSSDSRLSSISNQSDLPVTPPLSPINDPTRELYLQHGFQTCNELFGSGSQFVFEDIYPQLSIIDIPPPAFSPFAIHTSIYPITS